MAGKITQAVLVSGFVFQAPTVPGRFWQCLVAMAINWPKWQVTAAKSTSLDLISERVLTEKRKQGMGTPANLRKNLRNGKVNNPRSAFSMFLGCELTGYQFEPVTTG